MSHDLVLDTGSVPAAILPCSGADMSSTGAAEPDRIWYLRRRRCAAAGGGAEAGAKGGADVELAP